MSKKRKTCNADFQAKLVLGLLEGDKTLNEIASRHEVLPKSLQDLIKELYSKSIKNKLMN